eukprot:TRINITY_DN26390_c0_g2_i3.p1 TRINITY_DN26390_c0_g2~~TRINITY_DN26390_c0_g2_i3.p1  ORF type:complete len:149 (-),score=7.92 TRINITY_DN26390_c0_g2_i3:10-456(-)
MSKCRGGDPGCTNFGNPKNDGKCNACWKKSSAPPKCSICTNFASKEGLCSSCLQKRNQSATTGSVNTGASSGTGSSGTGSGTSPGSGSGTSTGSGGSGTIQKDPAKCSTEGCEFYASQQGKCNTCFKKEIGRAVQQECRDRSRMPSSA